MATKSNKNPAAQTELELLRTLPTLGQDEALRFLSLSFNIDVGLDVLWLHVYEGRLSLAIEFDGQAFGRRGRIVSRPCFDFVEESRLPVDRPYGSDEPIPEPWPATRAFDSDSVLELPAGFPERLLGPWNLCCAGDWKDVTRTLSGGSLRRDPYPHLEQGGLPPSVFVARQEDPGFAWEITDDEGTFTRDFLGFMRPVFRPSALEKFIVSLFEPQQENRYQGQRAETLLCMLGALIEADGTRKQVIYELEKTGIRGSSRRSLDEYLRDACQAYEKARSALQSKK